jgi:hypothetical protein
MTIAPIEATILPVGWMREAQSTVSPELHQPTKGMLGGGTLNLFIVRLVRAVCFIGNQYTRALVRSPGESHCYIYGANMGIHR